MEKVICRLLPFAVADGPHNMAADEVLLQAAAAGQFSLRFYGWTQATLSLGYFQRVACRLDTADASCVGYGLAPWPTQLASALPYVRRPTGGATLVHHHEVTYALAIPRGGMRRDADAACGMCMHQIIAAALTQLGVSCRLAEAGATGRHPVLCFHQFTPGDVLCGGAKIAGSAQRKHRHGLLQHGAILLAQSPFAPSLPGIQELCGKRLTAEETQAVIVAELANATGWQIMGADWDDAEKAGIEELAQRKYGGGAWNDKR